MDTARYPAEVFWSNEDDGFIAIAPDLPGCSAFGASQTEALEQLQDAICAWIEAAHKAGNHVPEPSLKVSDYSGKLLVRLPKNLHRTLAHQAHYESVSLNQYVVALLASASANRRGAFGYIYYSSSILNPFTNAPKTVIIAHPNTQTTIESYFKSPETPSLDTPIHADLPVLAQETEHG